MSESSPSPDTVANQGDAPLCILCVDDEANILSSLGRLFHHEPFRTLTAASGAEGLEILKRTENVGLILSDFRMPEMNGAAFLQAAALIAPDSYRMILTGYADTNAAIAAINEGGASRFLTKPFTNKELLQIVQDGLGRYRLILENRRLTAVVSGLNEELAQWNDNLKKRVLLQTSQLRTQLEIQKARSGEFSAVVVRTYADILGQRNPWITRHSRMVATLADQITENLGLGYQLREDIRVAALLHDIGLLGMSDRFLTKRMMLMSTEDLEEYRSHSVRGEAAVAGMELLREVGLYIRHHHEAFDGGGYPDGLAGEEISLGGRVIALADWICDAFAKGSDADAKYLVSRTLDREMGRLFDPSLAAAAKVVVTKFAAD